MGLVRNYLCWLHTQWPAGHVEKLPVVREDGSTSVPGLFVVGDITGIPLLKFSADTGARAVQTILQEPGFQKRQTNEGVLDLIIIGCGVAGAAAALEAKKSGLSFALLEATEPFSTVVNFPKGKPIFTYPTDMTPAGELQFGEDTTIKEGLVEVLHGHLADAGISPRSARAEQVKRKGGLLEVSLAGEETLKAHRVIVGIGRSGNFRKLGVEGEDSGKVFNRLHDPKDYRDKNVLVVGGGDSAMETAIAIAECGGSVTLSYRKPEFTRPKPDNLETLRKLEADPMADVAVENPVSERVTTAVGPYMGDFRRAGSIRLMMSSRPKKISPESVIITNAEGQDETLPNHAVFAMIGREAPLDFFRRSGVRIRGEWRLSSWVSFLLVLLLMIFIYHWKKNGVFLGINEWFANRGWFPFNMPTWWTGLGEQFADPHTLAGTLRITLGEPGFYYSMAYCIAMICFGFRRIRRRKTPYVRRQTLALVGIQVVFLFLIPYIILPWMGVRGWFDQGILQSIADELFPAVNYGHGREYWRAFGFILAWPLFFWNVFTDQPHIAWLAISFFQTFIIIPLIVWKWGKGAYCGWICSCGGMAETMGDAHRHKMPHGPGWNRLNMIGQIFLGFALLLLFTRTASWVWPNSGFSSVYAEVLHGLPALNYVWFVDLFFAGIIGFGMYWHFSGRVWCRFACPLAALMHIYARFSRFRIIPEKKKCISCNICTSVCHQGIDIMNFANKGLPMEDPECVRCSACVQSCPTGVLQFGEVNRKTGAVIRTDRLAASPVLMQEITVSGRPVSSQK